MRPRPHSSWSSVAGTAPDRQDVSSPIGGSLRNGQDNCVRRRGPSRPRAGPERPRRRGKGDVGSQGPQRRPGEEVGRPHDHQRWRFHRQGDRAGGPVREDRRRAGQGSRQEDRRRRWRRHDHRDRAGPGPGSRGLAQRRGRREPARPEARHREGRREGHRDAAQVGQGGRDQGADRRHRCYLGRRHPSAS